MTRGAPASLGGRLPRAVLAKAAAIAVIAFAPVPVAALLAGLPVAIAVGLGLVVGLSAGLQVRPGTAAKIAILNVLFALAGMLVVGSPAAAALLVAVAGLALGPANGRGMGKALMPLPLMAALSATGLFTGDPSGVVLGIGAGAAWAIAITSRVATRPDPVPLDVRESWTHALVLAGTTSAATFVALSVPLPHGYWIVVTLCAVLVPAAAEQAQATAERVGGTLIGAMVGVFAGLLLPPPLVAVAALALLVLMIAYGLVGDGRRKVLWLTVLLVLILGGQSGTTAVDVALQRLAWTLVGAALVAMAAGAVAWLDRRDPIARALGR